MVLAGFRWKVLCVIDSSLEASYFLEGQMCMDRSIEWYTKFCPRSLSPVTSQLSRTCYNVHALTWQAVGQLDPCLMESSGGVVGLDEHGMISKLQ